MLSGYMLSQLGEALWEGANLVREEEGGEVQHLTQQHHGPHAQHRVTAHDHL